VFKRLEITQNTINIGYQEAIAMCAQLRQVSSPSKQQLQQISLMEQALLLLHTESGHLFSEVVTLKKRFQVRRSQLSPLDGSMCFDVFWCGFLYFLMYFHVFRCVLMCFDIF